MPTSADPNEIGRQANITQRLQTLSSKGKPNAVIRLPSQLRVDLQNNERSLTTTFEREECSEFFAEKNIRNSNVRNISKLNAIPRERENSFSSKFEDVDRKLQLLEENLIIEAIEDAFNGTEESCHQAELAWQKSIRERVDALIYVTRDVESNLLLDPTDFSNNINDYDNMSIMNVDYPQYSRYFIGKSAKTEESRLSNEQRSLAKKIIYFATDEKYMPEENPFIDPTLDIMQLILQLSGNYREDKRIQNTWDEFLRILDKKNEAESQLYEPRPISWTLLNSTLQILGEDFFEKVVKVKVDGDIKKNYRYSRGSNSMDSLVSTKDDLAYIENFVDRLKENWPKFEQEPKEYMIIYYCLRSGKRKEASDYAKEKYMDNIVGLLDDHIKAYKNNCPMENILHLPETREKKSHLYEKIVFALLTYDPQYYKDFKEELFANEDSLWGRTNIIESTTDTYESYTTVSNHCWSKLWFANNLRNKDNLHKFANFICRKSEHENFFDESSDILPATFTYVNLFFRCQMFQQAINHMYNNLTMTQGQDLLLLHCAHLAIILQYNKLYDDLPKNVPEIDDPQWGNYHIPKNMMNSRLEWQTEFNSLIRQYIKKFYDSDGVQCIDVEEAIYYIFLIRPQNVLENALIDLTLRCSRNHRSLEKLERCLSNLAEGGTIKFTFYDEDECREKDYCWDKKNFRKVVSEAAEKALNYGWKSEAINLNLVAENYDKAFENMSENLSSILDPLTDYSTPEIRNHKKDANRLWENYHMKVKNTMIKSTFAQLVTLVDFTENVKLERYQEAYKIIYKSTSMTSFFPEDEEDIRAKVSDYKQFDRCIQRVMYRILLDTMLMLTEIYKNTEFPLERQEIDRKAKALEEYASLLSGNLPRRSTTISDLARLRNIIK